MLPFLYILWILFGELGRSLDRQPDRVKGLVGTLRLIVLVTWSVYPIAYLLPSVIGAGATAEVVRQVAYSIADILAKPAFGLLVLAVATAKSEAEPKGA